MSAAWLYPFIPVAGLPRAAGNSVNGQLNKSMANPDLAVTLPLGLSVLVFASLFAIIPRPLPTARRLAQTRRWAPTGGITFIELCR